MKKYILIKLSIISFLILLVACSKEIEFEDLVQYSSQSYTHIMPKNKVDILVVMDNSKSMVEEQDKLKKVLKDL